MQYALLISRGCNSYSYKFVGVPRKKLNYDSLIQQPTSISMPCSCSLTTLRFYVFCHSVLLGGFSPLVCTTRVYYLQLQICCGTYEIKSRKSCKIICNQSSKKHGLIVVIKVVVVYGSSTGIRFGYSIICSHDVFIC